jgi:hypothetical protein
MNKCPKCSHILQPEVEYCTNCGESLTDNAQPTLIKSFSNWFQQSIKKPMTANTNQKYFGFVSIGINMVLFTLFLFLIVKQLFQALSFLNPQIPVGVNLFSRIFLIVLFYTGVQLGCGYGIHHVFIRTKLSFFQFVNKFASYTNLMLIIAPILDVMLMMGGLSSLKYATFRILLWILLVLWNIIWQTGYTMMFATGDIKKKFDRIHVVLISIVANSVAIGIAGKIFYTIVKGLTTK